MNTLSERWKNEGQDGSNFVKRVIELKCKYILNISQSCENSFIIISEFRIVKSSNKSLNANKTKTNNRWVSSGGTKRGLDKLFINFVKFNKRTNSNNRKLNLTRNYLKKTKYSF